MPQLSQAGAEVVKDSRRATGLQSTLINQKKLGSNASEVGRAAALAAAEWMHSLERSEGTGR